MTHQHWKNPHGEDPNEREPVVPEQEPGNRPDGEPGNELFPPDADRPPGREERTVSDPGFRESGEEADVLATGVPNWRPGHESLAAHVSPLGRREGVLSDPDR